MFSLKYTIGKKTIKTDGIVFSNKNQKYQETIHLKMKPKELITNDYLYIYDKRN